MDKLLRTLAVIIMTSVCGFAGELKVLMVGNSFTHSVLTYLPSLVKASAEDKLLLGQAGIPAVRYRVTSRNTRSPRRIPPIVPIGPIWS